MDNKNAKALKSAVWYTVSNFLTRAIGLITTPIFTRLMTKAEFGLFNDYSSWLSILTIITTIDLSASFISARYDFEDDFDGYVYSTLALSSLSVVAWTILLNAFFGHFHHFFGLERIYLNCMMTSILFNTAVIMFQIRERYMFKYKATVLTGLILSVGSAFVSVCLVVNMADKLSGRIFGSVIPNIVLGFVIFIYIGVKGRHIKVLYWKYAIPIALPFIPHLLSLTVLNSVDRIMITNICGEEQTALYGLAYSTGAIVTILLTSMNTAYSPWLGAKLHENSIDEVREFSKMYISAFVYLCIGIMLLTPEVLWILGGATYSEARYVMPPITCGVGCQFLYTMFVNVEQYMKKTMGMAIGSVSAASLNYILNLIFIPRYGYIAAAYTTLIGYLWLVMVHMYLVKKIGYQNVYDYRIVSTTILILLSTTFGVNILFHYDVIRYVFVVLYALITIYIATKYGNKIILIVKDMKKARR